MVLFLFLETRTVLKDHFRKAAKKCKISSKREQKYGFNHEQQKEQQRVKISFNQDSARAF